ncbi:MAG: universal stress protein [Nostocaceae cyanobacterium]|nr:universal stress protein [Nostocaceae cyanobacterium]
MFHKILVAIDKTDMGQQVFDEALFSAKAMGANLMLLHVLSPFDEQYLQPMFLEMDSPYPSLQMEAVKKYRQQWEELKQERLDWLRSLTEEATNVGIVTEFTQNIGDPGKVICEQAKSWDADLIILGRRGLSGLSEFFLGSVSNYVLHHAHCSVLTLQANN